MVRHSTREVAHIGETKRNLSERINNYTSAKLSSRAGSTNKKVYSEQQRLAKEGDYLHLEFTDCVAGYSLKDDRERVLAESLLVGYMKPYLQEKAD